MFKLTFCLTRLPSLTLEAFQDYWWNKHAPLVTSHRDALRIERYVQLHSGDPALSDTIRELRGGGLDTAPAIYDGVAQLWWKSAEELAAAMATPDGAEAGRQLYEDEAKFVDFARSPLWFGEEKVVFG
ncbi:MAG: EthD domain-containing protein [Parvibaculum sp.]|nr:EthD domain-containing protein [Parvibaculum sp.]